MLSAIVLATAIAAGAQSTSVPFALVDNRMVVQATIDGQGPFSMVVDTGTTSVSVTPAVAQRLRLAARGGGAAIGAGSGSTSFSVTGLSDLALGSLHFKDLHAEVLDLSRIQRAFGFPHLDGIIGYEVLHRLRMGVDMDRSELTFSYAPIAVPANAADLAFTVDEYGIPQVSAAVDGVHGTFVIDTGDRSSLTLFRRFAQANDFYRDPLARNVITGIGIGGPIYSDVLRTTVSLFGATIPGVVTRATRDKGGFFATAPQDASIGVGLLKRFNMVYDYPNGKLFAWPSRYFGDPDAYRPLAYENGQLHFVTLSLSKGDKETLPRHAVFGAAAAQGDGGVRVTAVIPNSAAAIAGVQPGDTIRGIGDTPVATVAQFLMAVHDLSAGQRVNVNVMRSGAPLQLSAMLGTARDEDGAGLVTEYGSVPVDDSLRRTLLTLPAGQKSPAAAVLLIGGIGCYSVDVAANEQDAYLRLTHDLARAGFATMRIEKSGIGDSQGPPCRNVDFDAEVRGYMGALAALQRDPRVDSARVYLLGHSIGTIIAPRMALANRTAGVIVLEAVGRDWPEYEIRNLRRDEDLDGGTPTATDRAIVEKAECMQKLFFENLSEAQIERSMPGCKVPNSIYPVTAEYVREVAKLNVIEPWAKLSVPVLAIYGTSDFETELEDHQRIVTVVNASHPGSATLHVIPAMSHGLGHVDSPKAAETDDERGTIEQYDTQVSEIVIAWLRSQPR